MIEHSSRPVDAPDGQPPHGRCHFSCASNTPPSMCCSVRRTSAVATREQSQPGLVRPHQPWRAGNARVTPSSPLAPGVLISSGGLATEGDGLDRHGAAENSVSGQGQRASSGAGEAPASSRPFRDRQRGGKRIGRVDSGSALSEWSRGQRARSRGCVGRSRPNRRPPGPCMVPRSWSERMNGSPRVSAATPVPMSSQVRMGSARVVPWWGGWDSNPRPTDYESAALTG